MKIRKTLLLSFALFLSSTFSFAASGDEKLTKENINSKTKTQITARMEVLEKRVDEIKSIDFSILEKSEKRALKDELKEIKKEMAIGGYITISVGALLLIVLLVILLT